MQPNKQRNKQANKVTEIIILDYKRKYRQSVWHIIAKFLIFLSPNQKHVANCQCYTIKN